jgi:hypothetical protein
VVHDDCEFAICHSNPGTKNNYKEVSKPFWEITGNGLKKRPTFLEQCMLAVKWFFI